MDLAWRRAIRTDPLLSRAPLPDLRPFLERFNDALGGEDVDPLAAACESLVRDAELEPATVIQIATVLAETFTDELGTQSGATTKSLVATLGYVCQLLTSTMVGDAEARARRDPDTALENRLAWKEALARLEKERSSFAHALLDLDGLKQLNDNRSHAAGDAYIQEFATHLRTSLPDGPDAPRVYRIAGDEFVVIFPDGGVEKAREVISGVRENTDMPFSFGIASAPPDGQDAHSLYKASDARMYEEKRARKAAIAAELLSPTQDPDAAVEEAAGEHAEPHQSTEAAGGQELPPQRPRGNGSPSRGA